MANNTKTTQATPPSRRAPRGKQKWHPIEATDEEARAFAAALITHRNNTTAFREIYGKRAWAQKLDAGTVQKFAFQFSQSPRVASALTELREEAYREEGRIMPDLRVLAMRDIRNLEDTLNGDYAGLFSAVMGKSASVLDELPPWFRGVITSCRLKTNKDGDEVIAALTLVSKEKASELLQRWAELSAAQTDDAFSAVAVAVDELPAPPVVSTAPPPEHGATGTHVDILAEQGGE